MDLQGYLPAEQSAEGERWAPRNGQQEAELGLSLVLVKPAATQTRGSPDSGLPGDPFHNAVNLPSRLAVRIFRNNYFSLF